MRPEISKAFEELPSWHEFPSEYTDKLDHKLGATSVANAFDWINYSVLRVALAIDGEGGPRFARVSEGFLHELGLNAAAIVGRRVEDVLSRETHLPFGQAIRRALDGGRAVEANVLIRCESRRARRLAFTIHPVRTPAQGVVIEVRSGAAQDAGPSERRRTLIDHINLINAGTTYVYDRSPWVPFNLSVLLGFAPGDASVARSAKGLIHPADLTEFTQHRRRLSAAPDGAVVRVTARMAHSDGSWRWIEVREQVLSRTTRGGVRQILGFATDVTEHHVMLESLGEMSASLMKAEAEERRRIARELHDSMAQHLVAIDLTLSRLQRDSAAPMPPDALRDIREALNAAHGEVRTFSYLLHPPDLDRLGLAGTLRKFVTGFGRRTGLETRLDIDETMPPLRPAAELTLFRVAQEALMNVHQHAAARRVEVTLQAGRNDMTLEVIDDGVGLSDGDIRGLLTDCVGGVGIAGMKARVEHLGGRLEITSPSRGLRVRACLPEGGLPQSTY